MEERPFFSHLPLPTPELPMWGNGVIVPFIVVHFGNTKLCSHNGWIMMEIAINW